MNTPALTLQEPWIAQFEPVYPEPRIPPAIARVAKGNHERISQLLGGESGWAYARHRCRESYKRLAVSILVQQCWVRQEGLDHG